MVQTRLSSSMTQASIVICHWPPFGTELNWPFGPGWKLFNATYFQKTTKNTKIPWKFFIWLCKTDINSKKKKTGKFNKNSANSTGKKNLTIKLPVKKSRCGLIVCVNTIVSLGSLNSGAFIVSNCDVSVKWIESTDRYKPRVLAECWMTPSTLITRLLPPGTITGSPAARGGGLIDNLIDVLWSIWKK